MNLWLQNTIWLWSAKGLQLINKLLASNLIMILYLGHPCSRVIPPERVSG